MVSKIQEMCVAFWMSIQSTSRKKYYYCPAIATISSVGVQCPTEKNTAQYLLYKHIGYCM